MWRRKRLSLQFGANLQDNIDSDQSISEEEETLEGDWSEKYISLGGPMDNKGEIQVLSQFEKLRDSCQLDPTEKVSTSSCEQRQVGFCIDDEVEDPLFNDEDDSIRHPRISACYSNEKTDNLPTVASISNSDEEITSADEKVSLHTLGSVKRDVGGTWSKASREAEALLCLYENSSSSSSGGAFVKENKSSKRGRDKAKPKFSFGFQSSKEDLPLVLRRKKDQLDAAADRDMNQSIDGTRWVFQGQEIEQTEIHTDIGKRGRNPQIIPNRNPSPSGDGSMDGDDLIEALGNRLSSDDEENPQSFKSNIPCRTMLDQFQEAFGTVPVNDERPHLVLPRPLGGGLFGRLQQVIQSEKVRDSEYLKNLCAEDHSKDERDCIAVRILSRSLEAKLTVCSCTFIGDGESSCWEKNMQPKMKIWGRTLTIIFNSRICCDVDLEVGNLICIHSPWKKVQVKETGRVPKIARRGWKKLSRIWSDQSLASPQDAVFSTTLLGSKSQM
ncbi:uncharacterized protein LOC111369831 isoform X3 [Olea europaea var. sylvestris]|uniref:uncharacterized protein LOC111369831 isoform X3 n=1 Tax=Olea europaea var. sylvestris TaxID=158386 RepID=UPI000C1D2A5A|nr:uncharacterized protein LOC111369831 isoform X3 [Olea europaea var. sylvestris]